MSTGQKILVRGVNWLGDAVMTTPALQRLREASPRARITLLTHAKLVDLWQHHPAIDSVLAFQDGESPFAIARRLSAEQFDTALVLPNSPRSALEVFLARIPERIGVARPWRSLLLTRPIPPHPGIMPMRKRSRSEVEQLAGRNRETPIRGGEGDYASTVHQLHHYLHLAAALGAQPVPLPPRLEVTAEEVAAIKTRFGVPDGETAPLLGLNAGAEYGPAKRWPRERFAAAAVELQRRTGCRWWIFGGQADESLANSLAADIRGANAGQPGAVRSIAGQTSLRELCAALKACRLVITNDTGPMHVAAAVGSRVVVPFGSTSPELTGPGLPGDKRHRLIQAQVPCAPCFLRECPIDFRCMNGIAVDTMVEAALELLRDSP